MCKTARYCWMVLCISAAARGEMPSPFVYLYDTGTAGAAVTTKKTWTLVPEGKTAHAFAGDVVLWKDALAVVLRRNAHVAEVYSRTPAGLKRRAAVAGTALSAIRIVANDRSAVEVAGSSVAFRLTAGGISVRMRCGEAAGRLAVRAATRYVVVPDYFGNDMVFAAADCVGARVGLPAERCVLNLVDGGEAIVMCVWQSAAQNADVVTVGTGKQRKIDACEIECAEGKSIWLAVLEGAGIWHERTETRGGAAMDWKPPFAAKWRASFVGPSGSAESVFFAGRPPAGRRVVVYPLDRDRSTPMTVFCPVDVQRNTLGVGPCPYILDLLGVESEPAEAVGWIEKQFKRKRDGRAANQIAEQLGGVVEHYRRLSERVRGQLGRYDAFDRRVRGICGGQKGVLGILDGARGEIARATRAMATVGSVKSAADRLVLLSGRSAPSSRSRDKPDALAKYEALCERIRAADVAAYRPFALCRMAARRVKQWGRTAGGGAAADAVRRAAEEFLKRTKCPAAAGSADSGEPRYGGQSDVGLGVAGGGCCRCTDGARGVAGGGACVRHRRRVTGAAFR